MQNSETLNELKAFFSIQNKLGYTFYYPMSGLDLSVIRDINVYNLFNFVFCDLNFDHPSLENELGLQGIRIAKIETLSEPSFNFLNEQYKQMDKSQGWGAWPIGDHEIANDLLLIKKYYLNFENCKDDYCPYLILIQGEASRVARLLQNLDLNLNLVISVPGGPYNGRGASEFLEVYKGITQYEPDFIIGFNGAWGGFSELDAYINFRTGESFNYFTKSNDLKENFEIVLRGTGILSGRLQ